MTMRRLALAVLAATCVSALAVGAATAAPPDREPLLLEDGELEGACPFLVGIEILANKEYVTFFSNGRILVTGKLFVRLTNADKPTNHISVNISGAAHITTFERLTGHNLIFLFPFDAGGPAMLLTTGRVDIVRAEDGSIVEFTTRAPTKDVCAALA
jgi:hypothetical protein